MEGFRDAMNQVKIAIVGCGAVTQELHAPTLLELHKRGLAVVAAVYDPNKAEADAVLQMFPLARRCESLEELVAAGCNMALVASPARYHAGQAVKCLESGLHVLCEKPIAGTQADAESMLQAARKADRLLAVGHVRRFFKTTQTIKQLVEEKRFGRLLSFEAKEGGLFRWPARSASFFDRKVGGGGVMLDNGIHALDLLLWWFGQPNAFTYEDDAMGGVETNCRVAMDYGGFKGSLQLSWDYAIANGGYCLKFENAWIYWRPYSSDQLDIGFPGLEQALHGTCYPASARGFHTPEPASNANYYHSFLPEWLNFIAAMEGREQLLVSGDQAIKSLSFVEQCYAQRRFMEPPWLTDVERVKAHDLGGKATA
jgi:predicted dehydrogenase